MNREPYTTEIYDQLMDELTSAIAPQPVPPALDRSPASQLGAESDQNEFSRAATILAETTPAEAADAGCQEAALALRYIQGIVQGQRVYIITNLLEGESQRLFQPQMVWTIGRNREAALPLQDRALSRRHAVILYVQNTGFQLIDLNSMNGSFINGVQIQQRSWLKDGDRVCVGSTHFTFFLSGRSRAVEAIHPEVLARFIAPKSQMSHIDYSALEEPEILFKPRSET